jgi:hypothetical protein
MYLPGVSASSEIVEVKKFKGGYVFALLILIIFHYSDFSVLVIFSRRDAGRDERAGNRESWGVQRCHEREDLEGVWQNTRGLQQNALCVEANSCGVLMAAGEVSQHCTVHFFNFNFSDASDWLCPAVALALITLMTIRLTTRPRIRKKMNEAMPTTQAELMEMQSTDSRIRVIGTKM